MLSPLAAAGHPAIGQHESESAITDLDLDLDCTVIQSDDFGTTWACQGHKGIPVMVAEGDLRMFVSYGLTSTAEKAAEQTFRPSTIWAKRSSGGSRNARGAWKPFATILRYFTVDPTEDGKENGPTARCLVVTRIEPGATCQIA